MLPVSNKVNMASDPDFDTPVQGRVNMTTRTAFPEAAFADFLCKLKTESLAQPELSRVRGQCAARAWYTVEKEIAFRVALYLYDNMQSSAERLDVAFSDSWAFQMVHGNTPTSEEDRQFWHEMRSDSDEAESFALGFLSGLIAVIVDAAAANRSRQSD